MQISFKQWLIFYAVVLKNNHITKYLDKNFKLGYGELTDGIVSSCYEDYLYIDILSREQFSHGYLKQHLETVFNKNVDEDLAVWTNIKLMSETFEIERVLNLHKVVLKSRSWEVLRGDKPFDVDFVYNKLPFIDKGLIKKVYREWFEEKTIEQTEKTMGINQK